MVRFVIFLFLATVYTTAFPQEKLKLVPRNSLVETPIETPNGEMQRKQVDLTRFTFHARDLAEFGKAFVAEKGREGLLEEQRFSDELPDIGSSRGGNYRSPWAVNFFGISSHPGKNGNPRVNNANWGAGLRYYQTRNWFYESNIMRNTKRGQMLTAGAGYEFNVFSIASHPISLGAELFVVAYEDPYSGKMYWGFIPAVSASIGFGNWFPSVGAVLRTDGSPVVMTAFLQIRF